MNKKFAMSVASGVFLLSLGLLWVQSKGGQAMAFNLPPSVVTQGTGNLFEKRAIERNGDGNFVLVVQSELVTGIKVAPEFPHTVLPPNAVSAVATDSNGQKWNLNWTLHKPESLLDGYSWEVDNFIFVYLPRACPPDVKWYDVTLKANTGYSTTWRVNSLQTAHHLMVGEPTKASLTFDGITVSGKAERFFPRQSTPGVSYLDCWFSAQGKSKSGKNWSVRFAGFNNEWEMPGQTIWNGTEDNRSFPIDVPQLGLHAKGYFSAYQGDFGSGFNRMGLGRQWKEFYPQRNQFVRVAGSFVLIQKNGKKEQVLQTVPFTLKVPIVFRPTPAKPAQLRSKKPAV